MKHSAPGHSASTADDGVASSAVVAAAVGRVRRRKVAPRRRLRSRIGILGLLVIVMGTLLAIGSCAATGASARGARLDLMRRSPNYRGDVFANPVPSRSPTFLPTMWEWMKGGTNRTPATTTADRAAFGR